MHKLILERLIKILAHSEIIELRSKNIHSPDFFIVTEQGELIFDAIITRLQALGENFKKIEKIQKGFSQDELKLDINSIVRFRDLVSHHYDLLDYEVIFNICKAEIPIISTAIKKYLATSEDLNK